MLEQNRTETKQIFLSNYAMLPGHHIFITKQSYLNKPFICIENIL